MKKLTALAMAAVLAAGMGTLAFAEEASFTTITPGVLTVGTSPDFAPYEFYYTADGEDPVLAGFDIALANRFAEEFGLTLQVIPMDFDGILMELQNGNIDLGMAGFSPDAERSKVFDFSDLYYQGGQAFCVNAANKDKYTDYSDFDGLSVGAQTGSIQYGLAQENTPNANIIGLAKVTEIVSELITGKLEGAFIEKDVALQYAVNYPELCVLWDVEYDVSGSAVALAKGNEGLLNAVNAVIAEVLEDGTMAEYIETAQNMATDPDKVYEGLLGDLEESTESAAE